MRRRLVVVGAVVLVAMAGLSLLQAAGTSRQRGKLADQERANQAIQVQIDKLSGVPGKPSRTSVWPAKG